MAVNYFLAMDAVNVQASGFIPPDVFLSVPPAHLQYLSLLQPADFVWVRHPALWGLEGQPVGCLKLCIPCSQRSLQTHMAWTVPQVLLCRSVSNNLHTWPLFQLLTSAQG